MLFIIMALLAFGLIALYSASSIPSYTKFQNTTYFIYHQLAYGAAIGLLSMYILSRVDYHFWQKKLPILIVVSLVLLAMVKISAFGTTFGGAARWLDVGPFSFQPSELAKLVVILYLAAWADKKKGALNDFYFGLLPSLTIIGLFSLLILWQPDFGTMLVLISVSFAMLFTAGINWKYFFWSAACGILSMALFVTFEPYRAQRIKTFFDPGFDPQGVGYQINQALMAIGAGGMWGYGYGLSRQKHSYLPEVMTDSIFAVIAEELGFFRVLGILLLFMLFVFRGFSIAKNAPDTFGKMVAFGITMWIAVQALINIAAIVNIIPLTGIPLPFFSYGSSALILNLAAMGILLNISRQASLRTNKA